jgi:hypothetical protein
LRKTLKNVLAEYGAVALVLYLVIFGLTLGGVYFALKAGWAPASATGKASTFVAAYIITKLTQPFRIGATVILTPLVATGYERVTGRAGRGLPSQDPPPTE